MASSNLVEIISEKQNDTESNPVAIRSSESFRFALGRKKVLQNFNDFTKKYTH